MKNRNFANYINYKKYKGNLSISIYLIIVFIATSCFMLVAITKINLDTKEKYFRTIKIDNEYELAIDILKLNAYYSIRNEYLNTTKSEEFIDKFKSYEKEGLKNIFSQRYFSNDNIKFYQINEEKFNTKVLDNGRYVDFYITIEYTDGNSMRTEYFKCRVFNPYIELYDNEKSDMEKGEKKWEKGMFKLLK